MLVPVYEIVGDTQVVLIADSGSFHKRAGTSPSVCRTVLYFLSGLVSLLHIHIALVLFNLVFSRIIISSCLTFLIISLFLLFPSFK